MYSFSSPQSPSRNELDGLENDTLEGSGVLVRQTFPHESLAVEGLPASSLARVGKDNLIMHLLSRPRPFFGVNP